MYNEQSALFSAMKPGKFPTSGRDIFIWWGLSEEQVKLLSEDKIKLAENTDVQYLVRRGLLLNTEEKEEINSRKYQIPIYEWEPQEAIRILKEKEIIKAGAQKIIDLPTEQVERAGKLKEYIETGLIGLDRAINPQNNGYISDSNINYLSNDCTRAVMGITSFGLGYKLDDRFLNLTQCVDSFLKFDDVVKDKLIKNPVLVEIFKEKLLLKGGEKANPDPESYLYRVLSLSDGQVERLKNEQVFNDVFYPGSLKHDPGITIEDLKTMSDQEFKLHANSFLRSWALGAREDERFNDYPRPELKNLRETIKPEHLEKFEALNKTYTRLENLVFSNHMKIEYAANLSLQEAEILSKLSYVIITIGAVKLGDEKKYSIEDTGKINNLQKYLKKNLITAEEAVSYSDSQVKLLMQLEENIEQISKTPKEIIGGLREGFDIDQIGGSRFNRAFNEALVELVIDRRGFFDKFKNLDNEKLANLGKGLEEAEQEDKGGDLKTRFKECLLYSAYPELRKIGIPLPGSNNIYKG